MKELTAIVAALPPQDGVPNAAANRAAWAHGQEGLAVRFTLLAALPPLRALLILDNLAGHKSATFVCWLVAHGIMPLYTPISGRWLNMAESIQRILVGRALAGQHPDSPARLIVRGRLQRPKGARPVVQTTGFQPPSLPVGG